MMSTSAFYAEPRRFVALRFSNIGCYDLVCVHAEAIDQAAIGTDFAALGRFLIAKKESDIAAFKTPDIRNVLVTGPYFHDGSQQTLWDVVDHYKRATA
jgi:cytochrome c peroxidase